MGSTTEGYGAKNNSVASETLTMTHNPFSRQQISLYAKKRKEIHYEICSLDCKRATVHLEKVWRDA